MATTKPVTFPPKRLAAEITSSDLSFKLSDIIGWDGVNDITSASFGTVHYVVFRDDANTQIEIMQFDPSTIANYATTGITINLRGLSYDGTSLTESSARKFSWPRNETIVEIGTNAPQLLGDFVSLGRAHTLTGIITFTESAMPRISASHTYGAGEEEYLATKRYVDSVALAGAPDASTTQKGMAEEATAAELTAGTAAGSAARLFANPSTLAAQIQSGSWLYFVEDGTGADDAYTATLTPTLTAYAAGQTFIGKFTVANTGACTLNIDGLGAKDVQKYVNGALAALETGDIVANQPVHLEYDGTRFVMLSIPASFPTTAIIDEMETFFGSTAITGAQATELVGGGATTLHYHIQTSVFVPAASCYISTSAGLTTAFSGGSNDSGTTVGLADAAVDDVVFTVVVPYGATTLTGITVLYERVYTGDVYMKFFAAKTLGAGGAPVLDTSDSYTVYSITAGASTPRESGIITVPSGAYNSVASVTAGDLIHIQILRDATHASDTLNNPLQLYGVKFTFS